VLIRLRPRKITKPPFDWSINVWDEKANAFGGTAEVKWKRMKKAFKEPAGF